MSTPRAAGPGITGSISPLPADVVRQLPPERRRRRGEPVVLYGCCCCCCCCCLHTVGAAIGAIVAGSTKPTARERMDALEEGTSLKNLPSIQWLFWTSAFIVVAIAAVVSVVVTNGDPVQGLAAGGFIMLMVGPLVLLVACMLTGLRIAANPALNERSRYWRDLGRIFLYGLIGTLAGGGMCCVPVW